MTDGDEFLPRPEPVTGALLPLAVLLDRERQRGGKVAITPPGNVEAFGDLADRCREGSRLVKTRLAAATPGSDEARYLAKLDAALDRGATHPAEAVSEVRALSGFELAVVLRQLGAATGRK
jgi:hypothetical protein